MEPMIERCPTCGKVKSAAAWNPGANAAAPCNVTYVVPSETATLLEFIPYGAPLPLMSSFTLSSADFCQCGWTWGY